MDDDQQFCLRWNNHQSTLISVFDSLLEHEALTDCTLAAEGKLMKAHKVVLSACSPYFAALLQEQYDKHPIFILKDIKFQELKSMIDYMYRGEVNICQDQLAALLKAAESLQIKGLSDNRSSSVATAPKPEHHRATLPTAKLSSGYTLEQTKRARIAGAAEPEIGSREGSCSPSRRRRKVRRRSIENALSDVHDNSNSSQHIQQTQSNASGLGAITAAASALAAVAAATPSTQSLVSNIPLSASTSSSTAVTAPGTTLSSSKKTDIVKGTTQHPTQHDAMNTENAQGPASAIVASGSLGTETTDAAASTAIEKSNHKQMHQHKQAKDPLNASGAASSSELVIEPKAEYDDEANDEPVEDLTLDEDDVGIDDLDQNAGTSQAGEGSSQGYAPWQHDRSPDELLLATQEAQQRDPQDGTTPPEITTQATNTSAQNESRIRVRNWLMLADKSILEKSYSEGSVEQQLTKNNNNTLSTLSNAASTNNNNTIAAVVSPTVNAAAITPNTNLNLASQNTPTIQRIGSIGRTTITCITPAGGDAAAAVVNPQAALAAAGVELDAVDDNNSMTEVVVKIENSTASSQDEDEEMAEEGDDAPTTETNDEEDEGDANYDDIKLSSPMMWAIDSVKIEQEEEFEDILTAGFDNNTMSLDNDDEFIQTVPSVAGGNVSVSDMDLQKNRILVAKKRVSLETLKSLNKQPAKGQPYVTQIELQDPQELLEKHQHFQKLHLQPNQPVQIKLRSIPATITSVQPNVVGSAAPPLAPLSHLKCSMTEIKPATSNSNLEFKSTISEDRRYRMITQNQRTRKESLEHSDDMIYNADIEKPWVCRNCNRNYKWKNSLKCHLKNECGQPPRYFCSKLCGYATNVHSNLKRHMNTKCRERTEEDNQMLLQQVQVQQPQLVHQTQTQTTTTSTTATMATSNCGPITTAVPAVTTVATATNTSNNNANNNNTAISTVTPINNNNNSTSTYTLVFQKSE